MMIREEPLGGREGLEVVDDHERHVLWAELLQLRVVDEDAVVEQQAVLGALGGAAGDAVEALLVEGAGAAHGGGLQPRDGGQERGGQEGEEGVALARGGERQAEDGAVGVWVGEEGAGGHEGAVHLAGEEDGLGDLDLALGVARGEGVVAELEEQLDERVQRDPAEVVGGAEGVDGGEDVVGELQLEALEQVPQEALRLRLGHQRELSRGSRLARVLGPKLFQVLHVDSVLSQDPL